MEEVKVRKRFGKKATMWENELGERITKSQLNTLIDGYVKSGVVTIEGHTFKKVS